MLYTGALELTCGVKPREPCFSKDCRHSAEREQRAHVRRHTRVGGKKSRDDFALLFSVRPGEASANRPRASFWHRSLAWRRLRRRRRSSPSKTPTVAAIGADSYWQRALGRRSVLQVMRAAAGHASHSTCLAWTRSLPPPVTSPLCKLPSSPTAVRCQARPQALAMLSPSSVSSTCASLYLRLDSQ